MKRTAFIAATTAGAVASLLPKDARAQLLPGQQFLQQLTIGVSVPLTGPLADYGKSVVRGAQAAVDETNRFSVSLKQAFGLRALDDQNNGQQAITTVQIAQADPSIIGMIGNLSAEVTLAALATYANANFAVVVPTVTADSITARNYRNVFRLPTKDSSEGQMVARTLLSGKNVTAIAVTYDGAYGGSTAAGFVQYAKSQKHNAEVVTLASRAPDAAAAARTILDKSPTHVFLAGHPGDLGPIGEALRLAGYTGDFSLSDGFYTQATIDTYAKLFDGVSVASPLPPLDRIPSIYQLLRDMQNEIPSVDAFSAYGYAAAQLIILASQRTSATTRFALLSTLQQSGTAYDLLVGQYTFNFTGDATLPNVYFYTIGKDGFTFSRPAIPTGFVV